MVLAKRNDFLNVQVLGFPIHYKYKNNLSYTIKIILEVFYTKKLQWCNF
ncbi:hypothetical protein SAMN05421825_1552 [Epilithonimonas hungarica]|uniref:Uncharacterized protein n=1 Tax=Epilithonimonas hungarica TaxID=454006 RepID=A0A1G7LNK7_9FLAO|nr:hypothetical protein SAMN05421825_1552 [Epilithonimonas hungarica]